MSQLKTAPIWDSCPTGAGHTPGAHGEEPIGHLTEGLRTRQWANHFGPDFTLHDKSSLHSQALAFSGGREIHAHSRTKIFSTSGELSKPVAPLFRAVPHTCLVALGCSALVARGQQLREQLSAPPRCARSISSLMLSRSRPRQADRGLGHRCGNGVIRSNQASAQMAAWMRGS